LTQDALDLFINLYHLGLDPLYQGLRCLGKAHQRAAAIGLVGIPPNQTPAFHTLQNAGHAGQ